MSVDLDGLVASMPFAVAAGIEVTAASPQGVVGRLDWTPDRCTTGSVMHGGAIMTLADSTGAVCAFLNLPSGAITTTIESKTNFFRAVREGDAAIATTTPLHVGRSTIVVRTEVRDGRDKLVAHVVQTQAVIQLDARST
jgi:1,4-dihydroxy-2-naphthoyl-CoA hydrolase